MFQYDNKGTLYYLSMNNNKYYIYKAYTNNMLSSDIMIVVKYGYEDEEDFIKIIGFCYGDFEEDTLNYINDLIMKYEEEL